jgi:hypothetical protein
MNNYWPGSWMAVLSENDEGLDEGAPDEAHRRPPPHEQVPFKKSQVKVKNVTQARILHQSFYPTTYRCLRRQ